MLTEIAELDEATPEVPRAELFEEAKGREAEVTGIVVLVTGEEIVLAALTDNETDVLDCEGVGVKGGLAEVEETLAGEETAALTAVLLRGGN